MIWCPEDVYVEEPAALMDAYLAACQRLGVTVLAGDAVTAVLTAGGSVTGLRTSQREVAAPVVVDAAGAWVRQVGDLAGAAVAAAPVRHQLLITGPLPQIPASAPITRILDHAVYLRPARGGLMLGGFEASPLPVDPRDQPPAFDTDDLPLDLGVLRAMAGQVADLVPVAGRGARPPNSRLLDSHILVERGILAVRPLLRPGGRGQRRVMRRSRKWVAQEMHGS